jgi:DNA-binding NarL/FixJ family response regulator
MALTRDDLIQTGNLRVLLVDEIAVLRDGLRASLASEAGIEVVGAARSVPGALRIAVQTQPQLVVADLQIGGQSLADLVAGLARLDCSARVLGRTSQAAEEHMRLTMHSGARAYLLKDDGYAERVAARFAVAGAPITPREREVMALIGAGEPNKVFANLLRLSVQTVEKHRSNVLCKLGLHNTTEVTVYSIRQGLVGRQPAAAGR